jgi:copper(I)-binding protein
VSRPSDTPATPAPTSRSRAFRRPTAIALAGGVALGAVLLAGCGAGQQAQTSEQTSAVAGANTQVGNIAIRNAEIAYPDTIPASANVYPVGGTAPVEMVIVNQGTAADRLVSGTSPLGTVQLEGDTSLPAGRALVAGTDESTQETPGAAPIKMAITGLRQDIRSGLSYPLVLTFQQAGSVTVELPVAPPKEPREDQPAEAAVGGAH